MKRTSLVVAGFSAMVALGLIGYGCTSGDTVNSGTGGKGAGSGGSTTGGGQGGQTTGGGQGGQTTGGGQGGQTTTGQGGATGGGTGGATGGGTGGATGGGTGGATGGGQGGSSGGLVSCPSPAPGDKAACGLGSVTTPCTKNCGIKNSLAQKPCACITSTVTPPTAWDCSNQGPCMYPTAFDKTCYSLATAPPACPAGVVTGLTTCTNTAGATCGPLCGSATVASYSTGTLAAPNAPKPGYCACTNGFWQCASVAEWPM